MSWNDAWALATVIGMTLVTVLTRSFFFFSKRSAPLPGWVQRGLSVAPIAALAAVVVPELLLTQGRMIETWQDARLFGLVAATVWYAWRRGLLGTIVCGMAVYVPLHVGWGW